MSDTVKEAKPVDMRCTYPHRIVITLTGPEFCALIKMAERKRRTAKEQMLWLLAKEAIKEGLLGDDAPTPA